MREHLLAAVKGGPVPAHIAIVMDGNGRWAAKRGLPRIAGHRAGAKAIRDTIEGCVEAGVRYLTIYTFSTENWRRPAREVKGLMALFREVLEREIDELDRQGVRIVPIGRLAELPDSTRSAFEESARRTAANERLTLVVAVNYGARQEIADAAAGIAGEVAAGRLDPADVTEEVVARHLYTAAAGIPDPELVIRTSGELRLSNFLLFQLAYAELWVTKTLWPDFRRRHLFRAILDYRGRARRFGGV